MKAYSKTPVGAHYGLNAWVLQRITAVLMAAYTFFMIGLVWWRAPAGYADWKAILSDSFVRIVSVLFFLALLYHAWVGVRDIVMDYVKSTAVRLTLQALVGTALVSYLVWFVSILWGR